MDNTLIWQLASRYLRGKRSANAVPILSRISMVAIAVSAAAMIIVLSVFNGLESVAEETYNAFYPDIKVSVIKGKFFEASDAKLTTIKHTDGVKNITLAIEDNVLANDNNNTQQKVFTLKGIDKRYFDVNDVKKYIVNGGDTVSEGKPYTGIAGAQIINELAINTKFPDSKIEMYYANPAVTNPEADPENAYQVLRVHPAGVYKVSDEFDGKYVLAPLRLVQALFHEEGRYSSIEIKADPASAENIKKQLQQLFGSAYRVESRYEQNRTLYAVMGGEKWAVYAILVLVLFIASFNMVGALSMLVIEKQKDLAILKAMGAQQSAIRKIFLLEGLLWSLIGGLSGILLGTIICLLQQKFNLIKMNGSFLIPAFPVQLQVADFPLVIATILIVGLLAAMYPAIRATKAIDPSLKSA